LPDNLGPHILAHQGTLFLDEIGDMPLNLQAKPMKSGNFRGLSTRRYEPRLVDIRIIAATNVDIGDSRIKQGKFSRRSLTGGLPYRNKDPAVERAKRRYRDARRSLYQEIVSQEHNKDIKGIDREALELLIDYSWRGM